MLLKFILSALITLNLTFGYLLVPTATSFVVRKNILNDQIKLPCNNNNLYYPNEQNNFNIIKNAAGSFFLSMMIFTTSLQLSSSVVFADDAKFKSSLTTLIDCKEVLRPVPDFIKYQQYDNARTNIKYCLNQLELQKKVTSLIQNSVDYTDDADYLDSMQEAGNRIANTAIQLDSTIYTLVFIPSEDGELPPSAQKYVKESSDFYKALIDDLDVLINVAKDADLTTAKQVSVDDLKTFPKVLFKTPAPKAKVVG